MCRCQRNSVLLGLVIFAAGYMLGRKEERMNLLCMAANKILKEKEKEETK